MASATAPPPGLLAVVAGSMAPVVPLIGNPEIVVAPELATKSRLPSGVIATPRGAAPDAMLSSGEIEPSAARGNGLTDGSAPAYVAYTARFAIPAGAKHSR